MAFRKTISRSLKWIVRQAPRLNNGFHKCDVFNAEYAKDAEEGLMQGKEAVSFFTTEFTKVTLRQAQGRLRVA